jgi:hypothetical protein
MAWPSPLKRLRRDSRPDDARERPIRLPAGCGSLICHQRASEIASVKHAPTWDQARRDSSSAEQRRGWKENEECDDTVDGVQEFPFPQ